MFFNSCADAKDRQDRANKTLVNVKAGIEHLADKLQHLKAVRTRQLTEKIASEAKQERGKRINSRHAQDTRKL